jgi:RNA polymerase sigma-70 factor (ECF subfamily)
MRERFEREALPLMGVLYSGALKLTRDPREAEDLVQDTYVRAFERFHLYHAGTNLKAWMYRVMTNRFINLYRRRKTRPDNTRLEDIGDTRGEEDRLMLHDFQSAGALSALMKNPKFKDSLDDRLHNALEGLGREYREVLIMNVIGEMPYRDISAVLEIPLGTVMSRLSRAKAMLRERIGELGREEIPGAAGSSSWG